MWRSARRVALSIALALLAAPRVARPPIGPPNIVVILADDLGIGDVCAYGALRPGPLHAEPRRTGGERHSVHQWIRRRADLQPVARRAHDRPLSAALRSRVQPGRHRAWAVAEPRHAAHARSCSRPTSEPRGYATGIIGKWHLGPAPPQNPVERGFDEFFGFVHGAKLYYPTVERAGHPPDRRGSGQGQGEDRAEPAQSDDARSRADHRARLPHRRVHPRGGVVHRAPSRPALLSLRALTTRPTRRSWSTASATTASPASATRPIASTPR